MTLGLSYQEVQGLEKLDSTVLTFVDATDSTSLSHILRLYIDFKPKTT